MNTSFRELRRRILEDEYSQLNSMQRKAVFETGSPLLILAGAGSGKTTVIVNKIGYLIKYGSTYVSERDSASEEDIAFLSRCLEDKSLRTGKRYDFLMRENPIDAKNILAITFTNKAAGEMRERIERLFDISADALWALTFHSLCVRILRSYIHLEGFDSGFTIYDENDSTKLLERCIKELGLDERYKAKLCKNAISRAKTDFISADEFASKRREALYPKLSDVYVKYQKELKNSNALDFDDLIFFAVKILSSYPDVRARVTGRFKYVLVDEYQDTNPLQYKLVSLLVTDGNVCVVGDDDQSIYRFMGATIDNILSFERSFDNAKTIRLEQNYRSTSVILDAANGVISNNINRKGKNLWTDNESGEKIQYCQLASSQEESEYIAKNILTGVSSGKKYSDFCVLYRTHSQSHSIELALKGNGIPYRIFGGLAFFKRKEIQDMLAYLNVACNPNDKTRLLRIINEPKRGIGDTTLMRIADIAESNSIPYFEVLRHATEYGDLSRAAEKLIKFAALIADLSEKSTTLPLSDFFKYTLEVTGYDALLDGYDRNEKRTRAENLDELFNTIVKFEQEASEPTLRGFLEETALVSATDDMDDSDNAVVLMTMHCAKGLEFDTVFISGFEEGLFPSSMSFNEEGGIEEERRLCYVAITRAKRRLYILSSKMRMNYGIIRSAVPSRFLEEIPKELIDEKKRQTSVSAPSAQSRYQQKSRTGKPHNQIFGFTPPVKPTPKAEGMYTVGMSVKHNVFGVGKVLSVTPMSSDTLIEVAFETAGTKKLMVNYAKLEIL